MLAISMYYSPQLATHVGATGSSVLTYFLSVNEQFLTHLFNTLSGTVSFT